MNFDEKGTEIKSNRVRSLIRLLKSPAILSGSLKETSFSKPKEQIASRVSTWKPKESKTRWLSFVSNALCDGLKLLIQERKWEKFLEKLMN